MKRIFIDGNMGTTGLKIYNRLRNRKDLKIINIEERFRKDLNARLEIINRVDATILCLPDDASRQIVKNADENTVIIDTSSAHRTEENWVYGLPQLNKFQKEKIKNANRVSVAGCHACGFISVVNPLIENEVLKKDENISFFSITGYSGGGKNMIFNYENNESDLLKAPMVYSLNQNHKHLKEMQKMTRIEKAPIFVPIVSNFYSGMQVVVPFTKQQLSNIDINNLKQIYLNFYKDNIIKYTDYEQSEFLSTAYLSNKDSMEITIRGNDDRILIIARYDNLGKGASGNAIECLNLILGVDYKMGLCL